MKQQLIMGEIVRPQGVRGEIKIVPATPDPRRFLSMERLLLAKAPEAPAAAYAIEKARVDPKGSVVVKLSGIDDANAAEALRGLLVVIPRDEAAPLDDGAWYIADLIGCAVFDDAGNALGILTEIHQHGAADIWAIRGPRGFMMPALKRAIADVDIAAARIVLRAAALAEIAVYEDGGESDGSGG